MNEASLAMFSLWGLVLQHDTNFNPIFAKPPLQTPVEGGAVDSVVAPSQTADVDVDGPERPMLVRWRPVMMPSKHMMPAQRERQGEDLGTQEERALSDWLKEFLSLRRVSASEERRGRGERKRGR
ncbi:hypothetical protein TIFTF001_003866 [Ficus carica]|uniref:Uncharacterized protein n=1 Tax=Ficus carica TaxID=3494 RepID=A0AA87ZHF3_FICCA|nr:hypothetical protein TIFTF001_003866 [Ficus carica]